MLQKLFVCMEDIKKLTDHRTGRYNFFVQIIAILEIFLTEVYRIAKIILRKLQCSRHVCSPLWWILPFILYTIIFITFLPL